jgi:hypothetical protein
MNVKGKVDAIIRDERWLWDLTVLCDISHHLSYLHMKLQGQHKFISDIPGAERAFQMKLKTISATV